MSLVTSPNIVQVTVGDKELLTSGVVHLDHTEEIQFKLEGLNFTFRFVSDGEEVKFSSKLEDDRLIINMHNFKNTLGEGRLDPVPVAIFQERKLYVSWFVHTLNAEEKSRSFQYAFYLGRRDDE